MKAVARFVRFTGWDRCASRTERGTRCANAARWKQVSTGRLVCHVHRRAR